MKQNIEFEDLPEAEQMRLTAEFNARLIASNERKGQEVKQLRGLNDQLRAHLERRREFAQKLEALVAQAEHEDALLREEKERILAAA